ncbi:MAG: rhodanese-like domain-containing protein [Alphaproteobacteria bacterium]|nr:rhodanese-like domain-containing protein [Alphaproteobacteria bacterium]
MSRVDAGKAGLYALAMDWKSLLSTENLLFAGALMLALIVPQYIRRMMLPVPEIGAAALLARIGNGEDILVLDVRTPEEFKGETGHIAGAVNLPLNDLKNRLSQLGDQLADYRSAPVVLTCRTISRAGTAAGLLKNAGFSDLAVLSGGMARWCRENRPVSKI